MYKIVRFTTHNTYVVSLVLSGQTLTMWTLLGSGADVCVAALIIELTSRRMSALAAYDRGYHKL